MNTFRTLPLGSIRTKVYATSGNLLPPESIRGLTSMPFDFPTDASACKRSNRHFCIRNLTCSFAPLCCLSLLTESLGDELEDRPPVLSEKLYPFQLAHLRKIY